MRGLSLMIETEEDDTDEIKIGDSDMSDFSLKSETPELFRLLSPRVKVFSPKRKEIRKEILSCKNGQNYYDRIQKIVDELSDISFPSCKLNKDKPGLLGGAFSLVDINRANKTVFRQTNIVDNILKILLNETFKLKEKKTVLELIKNLKSLTSINKKIQVLVKELNVLFPYNSVFVKDVELCKTKTNIKMEMLTGLAEGDNLFNLLKNKKLDNEDILKLEVQILFIAKTLNKEHIYHNDYAARNIMVDTSQRYTITYLKNKDIALSVRNTFIPVLIDYDFIDDKFIDIAAGMNDEDSDIYLSDANKHRIMYKFSELNDLFDEKKYSELNNFNYDIIFAKNYYGGGKKKQSKKIRKHSGINQKTGKLKSGYKYGKKLKSGLKKIIKIT